MEVKRLVPMTYDKMFKSVLTSKEARSYLVDIISGIIKVDREKVDKNLVFKREEHNIIGISEKRKISDLIVEVSYGVINLEMNRDYYKGLLDRNHEYVSKIRDNIIKEGDNYKDMKKVVQINFDNYKIYDTEKIILEFEMRTKEGIKEGVNIKSYHVILPNVKKKYYNENSKDELIERLVIMTMEKPKELQKLIDENTELRPVGEKIVEISKEEELMGIYDEKEHERKVRNTLIATALEDGFYKGMDEGTKKGIEKGIEEGTKKGIIKTAKKMKLKNISIEDIKDITGLSKEEIEKL